MAEKLEDVRLFAWLSEDQLGSGEVGLKQALTPAGMIPLVAVAEDKMRQGYIVDQLMAMANRYDKPISLVQYRMERVLIRLEPRGGKSTTENTDGHGQ